MLKYYCLAVVLLSGSVFGFKYEIEVDGEKYVIDSDSDETVEMMSGIAATNKEQEQFHSMAAEEVLLKLETMISNLNSDLDLNQVRTLFSDQLYFCQPQAKDKAKAMPGRLCIHTINRNK